MSLKTWSLLFLIVPLAVAKVVDKLSKCPGFLLDETPPQMTGILDKGVVEDQNRYKIICQTYDNKPRFLTLYDTTNRIPVFSAYRFIGEKEPGRPKMTWMIEPQLENIDEKNMKAGNKVKTYNNQAGDVDYKNNGKYDRGHLFPSAHASTKSDKKSTFTFTNIVPQAHAFNIGRWKRMETCIKSIMQTVCINLNQIIESFVIVGAEPGTEKIPKPPNGRVNVPSKLWSAFCCYSSNKKKWIAGAYWGDNVPDGAKDKYLQAKTLTELHTELKMIVFPGTQCPPSMTVSEFYPEINGSACQRQDKGSPSPSKKRKTKNKKTIG